MLYDIPAVTPRLREGELNVGNAGLHGFGKIGWGGPCPPDKDPADHYVFHAYALDVESLGSPGLSKSALAAATQGHVLAEAELTGIYKRKTR